MQNIKEYVKEKKEYLKKYFDNLNRDVTLAIIQVNDNPDSCIYIKDKMKDAEEIGVKTYLYRLPSIIPEQELLKFIEHTNEDESVDGILVQMPLPKHIDEYKVKLMIAPEKDVDGFNPISFVNPCTPQGILTYLINNNVELKGKNAVVIGRSEIFGKSMAKMLIDTDCTVTLMHSKTPLEEQKKYVANADIVVIAIGRAFYLDNRFSFKKNAIIIDAGMNRDENNKLCGDTNRHLPVAFQSPVPGGVGLLTKLTIFENLLKLIRRKHDEY